MPPHVHRELSNVKIVCNNYIGLHAVHCTCKIYNSMQQYTCIYLWIHGKLRVNSEMIGHNTPIRNVYNPCPSCGEISKWIPSSVRLSRFYASQITFEGMRNTCLCREGEYITSSICCSDSFLPTLSNSHPFYSILLLYTLPVSLSFLFPYSQITSLGLQYSSTSPASELALSGFIQRRFWTLTSSTTHISIDVTNC